ncbi:hypothetical protein [Palleronia sp.]|uniref:hypothetical protein n=1 Tax=Palleronia sp. TaxID=1940284 RepID=UPI0035C82D46
MRSVFNALGGAMPHVLANVAACLVASAPATADQLEAAGDLAARPYPYELLGLRPGDPLSDVAALFDDRSEAEATGTELRMRVQSQEGQVLEPSYEATREIGDVGMQGRLSNAPQDHITAMLATEVFEKRPLAIFRVLRQPSADLPEPLALKAQLEDLYGPASAIRMQGQSVTLIYAWSTEGFIPDLDAQPVQTLVEQLGADRTRQREFRTCETSGLFSSSIKYEFRQSRDLADAIMPGCVATYEITYRSGPETSTIEFALEDYDLARQHRAEVDR